MSGTKVERRLADILAANIGQIHSIAWAGAVIEVIVPPLSPPVRRIIAEEPDLVCRLAGNDYKLVFALPLDASPAIRCLSPELVLPITAIGAIETKAGLRLVHAASKKVLITTPSWQHFRC